MLKDCFQLIAATGEFARGRLEAEKKAQDPLKNAEPTGAASGARSRPV
jgi:hypothetical protein